MSAISNTLCRDSRFYALKTEQNVSSVAIMLYIKALDLESMRLAGFRTGLGRDEFSVCMVDQNPILQESD